MHPDKSNDKSNLQDIVCYYVCSKRYSVYIGYSVLLCVFKESERLLLIYQVIKYI